MSKRKLTPEEIQAYRDLARAARRLRQAQERAAGKNDPPRAKRAQRKEVARD